MKNSSGQVKRKYTVATLILLNISPNIFQLKQKPEHSKYLQILLNHIAEIIHPPISCDLWHSILAGGG